MRNWLLPLAILLGISTLLSPLHAQENEYIVEIVTNKGPMKMLLYNDTPIHRDFFLSQVRNGYFDGSLFGRVIPGFVVQGGSEDSKGAAPGVLVGHGRSAMLLSPEFNLKHIPKKGAVAMPRQPDNVNPKQQSDGSQFFIVQGRKYGKDELKAMELQKNAPTKKRAMAKFYTPYKEEFDSLKQHDPVAFNSRVDKLNHQVDSMIRQQDDHLLYSPEEKEAYTTIGGSPHLRGDYTLFGEIIEGLEVVDSIAKLETDRHNRPYEDVVMKLRVVNP